MISVIESTERSVSGEKKVGEEEGRTVESIEFLLDPVGNGLGEM